jgi:RNA polymerase primary sigma factor
MGTYANKPIEDLSRELAAGLVRLRREYVDSAEALARLIDPQREYPSEFIVYRLTGYRPQGLGPSPTFSGRSLRADLLQLILDICASFDLKTTEYSEGVYDVQALARKYQVSTKTVQRWMREGLVARRMVFPDRKRRLAFLDSSVQAFVEGRPEKIRRSSRFSQMTASQRQDIIRRARRMASFTRRPLIDIARRLAARTGRAVETIRYTIRRNDREHPQQAVFPDGGRQIADDERQTIYQEYFSGVPAPTLAATHHRTRGSIYRIINEIQARRLLHQPVAYVPSPEFELPDADATILGPLRPSPDAVEGAAAKPLAIAPADLPPYLQALYEVPLLDSHRERDLFRRYNYLKFKIERLRKGIKLGQVRANQIKALQALMLQANMAKNQIIRANLRLVVAIAKKHLSRPVSLFDLISDGNVSLMRAVEKFDYSRGHRFSTYASWAIMRNFARTVPREQHQLDRFSTGHEGILDTASGMRSYDPGKVNPAELRESIDLMLGQLSPLERSILIDHYGLDSSGAVKTLDQMGKDLGISKERVRQIEIKAMKKLRGIAHPSQLDLLP